MEMSQVKCKITLLFLRALFEVFQLGNSNKYNKILKTANCEYFVQNPSDWFLCCHVQMFHCQGFAF